MSLRIIPVNFFDQSTDLAVSPAAVSTLPITNLQSNVRGDLWRSPNLNAQVMTGTWGGNVRAISAFGVWPSAGTSSLIGSSWRLQLFSDAAATVSAFDQTYTYFAPAGVAWGSFPAWGASPWGVDADDRTARLAPMVQYFADVYASAYRITCTDLHYVDTPYFEARRIWLGDYVDAPYNAKVGAAPAWKSSSQQSRSVGGSLRRRARARWRELRFETVFIEEADRAAWSDIVYVCDPANEIVISLFPGDLSPRKERDFTVMGSLEALNPMVLANPDFHTLQLAIVES